LLDDHFDLSAGHRLTQQAVKRIGRVSGTQSAVVKVFHAGDVPLAATVAELHDVLAIVFVDLLSKFAPERNLVVIVYEGVIGQDATAHRNGNVRRNNCPDSAARKFFFPVDARLSADAVVVIEAARNIRAKDSVLDR
jgi:hypothetical protein